MTRKPEKSEVTERFAANLRRFRETVGLSQEALAFRADIHPSQISLIESGLRTVRLDTLIKLAGALGVTTNDLVAGIAWTPSVQRVGRFDVIPEDGTGR